MHDLSFNLVAITIQHAFRDCDNLGVLTAMCRLIESHNDTSIILGMGIIVHRMVAVGIVLMFRCSRPNQSVQV